MEGRALVRKAARGGAEKTAAREQILLFRVGESVYGIEVRGLWEVLSPEGITSLPTPPYQICTALAYRGQRFPLIRLRELFGDSANSVPASARVLLTQSQGHALGLLVDEVLGVVEIDPRRVAPMPVQASALGPGLFRGLVEREERVIILLDADGLGGLPDVARFSRS